MVFAFGLVGFLDNVGFLGVALLATLLGLCVTDFGACWLLTGWCLMVCWCIVVELPGWGCGLIVLFSCRLFYMCCVWYCCFVFNARLWFVLG